jgi:hypothetical protein
MAIQLICEADLVLADSSTFLHFCRERKLRELTAYLASNGRWTLDVQEEVRRLSLLVDRRTRRPKYPGLQDLSRLGWPPAPALELSAHQLLEASRIRKEWESDTRHPKADRGEIATVLIAESLGQKLVIIDDGRGCALAETRAKPVPHRQTSHMAAEMVAAGALDEKAGKRIFVAVYKGLTERHFTNALTRYKEEFSRRSAGT